MLVHFCWNESALLLIASFQASVLDGQAERLSGFIECQFFGLWHRSTGLRTSTSSTYSNDLLRPLRSVRTPSAIHTL
jgi:hypothetical protein